MRQPEPQVKDGKRRGRRAFAAIAIVVALAAAAVAVVGFGHGSGGEPAAPHRPYATERVTRGKVSTGVNVQATLGFARERTLGTGRAGVVTWLPEAGKRISFGQALYAVDARPVLLLEGAVPMWREFTPRMTDGADVEELEADLAAMGYFDGTVDGTFTDATAEAIARLQHALGESCTPPPKPIKKVSALHKSGTKGDGPICGRLAPGSIVFGEESVRVSGAKAAVGAPVGEGGPVLGISSPRKVVRCNVELEDRRLAARGTTVAVSLPDGTAAKGIVSAAAPAIEKEVSAGVQVVVIPTTIRFRHQRKAKDFQHAAVTVHFSDVQSRDALTVPVEALIALGADRFGIEVPAPNGTIRRVSVKTGLFAGGRVVVSGHGVHRGLQVLVPR